MKKAKKNNRETNINNTIKGILLSDREVNSKNLKFSIFKEILLSDKKEELFLKKTSDFRNLIIFYKDKINEDPSLENANVYFQEVEKIRIDRINKIVENGKTNDFMLNKMKDLNRDKEIEDNWINRGYTCIKLTNGVIEVQIEELEQLNYQIKLLQLETIENIVTTTFCMSVDDLENWLLSIKDYSVKTYGKKPRLSKNIITVGSNEKQLEKLFIYYCLTDGKIHVIRRIKYN